MTIIKKRSIVFVVIFLTSFCFSQQRAANIDVPKIKNPRFLKSAGPTIYIDQTHQNFHQKSSSQKTP